MDVAHARLASAVLVALMLAGCASKPSGRRESPAGTAASGSTNATPATASSVPRKTGGGYYLDDGPGANPPADLDLVPDAMPRIEKYASGANRPYNVFGVDYVPDLSGASYKQRGVGSWYGRKFHGQRTSSGEIYDMYAMTAAHPTLPIPCYALVTNLQNGKSVIVRVNDRGPFLHNRVMDLSYAAALKLGYLSSGSGTIEVEMLQPSDIAAGRIPITSNSLYIASAAAAGRRWDPGATTVAASSSSSSSPTLAPATATIADAARPAKIMPTSGALDAAKPVALAQADGASRDGLAGVPATTTPSSLPIPPSSTPPRARSLSTTPASTPPSSISLSSTPPSTDWQSTAGASRYADRGIPADLMPDAPAAVKLPETATRGGFYLQLGAFRVRAGADSFASHVAREIDPLVAAKVQVSDQNGLYRVRIGPYAQRVDADSAATTLRSAIAQPVMVMPDAATR